MASSIMTLLLCAASLTLLLAIPSSGDNHLLTGQRLTTGSFLTEGGFTFIMQSDCNLVLYDLNRPIWASGTYGKGTGCFLSMQSDGNLVVYDVRNIAIWASNTARNNGNYLLILQKDRNVVIYSQPIWATTTNIRGSAGVVIAPALNGTVGVSGAEQNKVSEMTNILEVTANV
uniref:Lectin n=1 Tax=Epipactis helleborine TaxID=28472 RepID=Q39728_EPIHE|nr:lectin [Epipactis helleborine]